MKNEENMEFEGMMFKQTKKHIYVLRKISKARAWALKRLEAVKRLKLPEDRMTKNIYASIISGVFIVYFYFGNVRYISADSIYDISLKHIRGILFLVSFIFIFFRCVFICIIEYKRYRKINQLKKTGPRQKSVTERFLWKYQKKCSLVLPKVIAFGIIYSYLEFKFHLNMANEVCILAALGLLNILSQVILDYRIKEGYFGLNYDEAKQLLYFVKSKSDKNNKDKYSGLPAYAETAESNYAIKGEIEYP